MKKVLFIGNRVGVFRELAAFPDLRVVEVLALRGSLLHQELAEKQRVSVIFADSDKAAMLQRIAEADFDILVSNGCPFVLPISRLAREERIFLNVHPSLLPEGKGRHPVNGALMKGQRFLGATLHYMDDGIDTGRIIHQEKVEITEDIDLGLAYRISFQLEARVFARGMRDLVAADFSLPGWAQEGKGSYYSRAAEDQQVDFCGMSDVEILRRVRAFGIPAQGVAACIGGETIRVIEAESIVNPYLLQVYAGCASGEVLLRYENRLLVRSRDGVIKIKSYAISPTQ